MTGTYRPNPNKPIRAFARPTGAKGLTTFAFVPHCTKETTDAGGGAWHGQFYFEWR